MDHLAELKTVIDNAFGDPATWVFQDGTDVEVIGIFSSAIKDYELKGGTPIDYAKASYSMKNPPAEEGHLIIRGVKYKVLDFHRGDFETVIPLLLAMGDDDDTDGSNPWD